MPAPPRARHGERLVTLRRPTKFSFWPTRRARAHAKIQPILFALNPWVLIKEIVAGQCPDNRRLEALACLEQSREFFIAGTERQIAAARPLALYYSYMNLTKTLCLTRGNTDTFDRAQHGLSDIRSPSGSNLERSRLRAFPSPNAQRLPQNFDELKKVISGQGLRTEVIYEVKGILPQILSGHRLWAQGANQVERFVSIQDIQFWRNKATHEVWLRIYFFAHDLSRLRIGHAEFLRRSGLRHNFKEVRCDESNGGDRRICFEQTDPVTYPDRHPSDVLENIVSIIKPHLWATVATVPPYRRYYVYLCPDSEQNSLLPQLLSIYALTYFLGSVVRYRPQDFSSLLGGRFGPRIQDFMVGQSSQFLYLMVSEIARQDITKPSIV